MSLELIYCKSSYGTKTNYCKSSCLFSLADELLCDVQDEILAEEEKFVLRVEDLLSWVTVDVDATGRLHPLDPAACPLPSPSNDDGYLTPPAECNNSLFLSRTVSEL